ncbi:PAQR family membrane homeostasis protein TrhA [Rudaea sp.]|uniref:PAQR family membrane homeostasis protein TrhA n=1 Tax=Rudaea sp. TaxID=2136325 RepID=UPI002ED0C554
MNASIAATHADREEIANTLTHGLGIVLAVIGAVVLLLAAQASAAPYAPIACVVYGATMIVLYLASTLYHGAGIWHASGIAPLRPRLRAFDHIAIFLLIAGTYTPYVLIALRGTWGWSLFAIVWSLAALGTLFELTSLRRFRGAMVALYLGMGWVGIVAIKQLFAALAAPGVWLVLAGGLAYSLGVIFYKMKSLRYHHAIWHLFVLAGSVLFYLSILLYVIPGVLPEIPGKT